MKNKFGYVCQLVDTDHGITNYLLLTISNSSDKITEWDLYGTNNGRIVDHPQNNGNGMRYGGKNELYLNNQPYATLTFTSPIQTLKKKSYGQYNTAQEIYMRAQYLGEGTIIRGMFIESTGKII